MLGQTFKLKRQRSLHSARSARLDKTPPKLYDASASMYQAVTQIKKQPRQMQ